jgi:hypothetical protein
VGGGVWLTATAHMQTPQVRIPFTLRKSGRLYLCAAVFGHSFDGKNEYSLSLKNPNFTMVGHSFTRTFPIGGVSTVVTFTWTGVY